MPATLKIRPWNFHVEKGSNLGLHETLHWATSSPQRISAWGPYECRPRLYYRALVQKEFLESGWIGYQAIDDIGESGSACECFHALTDIDPRFGRHRNRLFQTGELAGKLIVRRLWENKALICAIHTYDWLNAALGLDRYPIVHRVYRAP